MLRLTTRRILRDSVSFKNILQSWMNKRRQEESILVAWVWIWGSLAKYLQRPLPFINHTINNSECRATGYRKQEKAGSLDALWVTVIAWTSQTKLPSAPACREARFWMDQPFPRAGDGALIHTGWNHFVLFPSLLLSGKMGGAKTERTKIIFHISSWSSEYWIIWEIFLGLFQIILRRQAFSENGHSAFGLIFWRPSVIDLLES